ncbi:MAG: dienelactone hydrolase family protein [Chloroflexi bacterium]|nr:dienelactone hydrolase family protein [Chloroflexota bacterium]
MNIATESNVSFGEGLRGILHDGGSRLAAVICHGAGRGLDTPLLEETARRLAAVGCCALRWNFGYMGVRAAPSSGAKREREELRSAMDFMQDRGPLVLIGKSFGARVSTYVAAGRDDVRGLVYFGLPLHAPGKPLSSRDWSHMAELNAPMLFLTGNRDGFCPQDDLVEVQKLVRTPFESHIVPGDHSFKPRGEAEAIDLALSWLESTF